ncbi:hypothetical protein, partial [uncultured Rothia sp.]|uniref:hypothetical protein n=1 Tax=uncultured Rothia sp. TaxID=316088 RepID=UPI002620CB90
AVLGVIAGIATGKAKAVAMLKQRVERVIAEREKPEPVMPRWAFIISPNECQEMLSSAHQH